MSKDLTAPLITFCWRLAGKVPETVLRGASVIGADATWLLHGGGVRQLEANLRRVRPMATTRELRSLSRAGMRSYFRYFAEAFAMSRLTPEQIAARVRPVAVEEIEGALAADQPVVMALGHMGNWDLAGAWGTVRLAPVTTVAERLKPEELFQEFLEFRRGIGLTIIPLSGDGSVFRQLLRAARGPRAIIPLLADRDLSARGGVEVDLFGARARVAAGPASLAVATGAPLVAVTISYERLRGDRRRAAGSPWGIVIEFHPFVPVPPQGSSSEKVAAMTQAWVDGLADGISRAPQDWHMLQKVFVDDLDPRRYAQTLAAATPTADGAPDGAVDGQAPA
ncbi:phosphatidylinositol mannoside acyltransferase [Cellulomonas cellasea]|uniref:phosphatidylinositol mannoside acyltransferase n=1 Tax=Cellulomonas cellasea TaxID=43670 RepID=UPI0025A32473|nr:phosphatidylinositol mannoside acyltransferase [Cellulomonas cellasea]MDM8083964.1 phosphatidylinositol mannoside acyltransferase [Cellulomonas cellasea]